MNRNTKNLLTAISCTAVMMVGAGCSDSGTLSVDGFYNTRAGSLAGDQCDEILLEAADAEGEEREAAEQEFRECVEQSIADQGGHAECRADDDGTCAILLEEISDVIDRVRAERGNEMPDCANPQSPEDEALCHLMDAYEICQLDHNGDGEPDVDRMPDAACEDVRERAENAGEEDQDFLKREHPECFGDGGGDGDTAGDPAEGGDKPEGSTDGGEEGDPDQNEDGSHVDQKSCDDIRHIAENASQEDADFLKRERPECFDETGSTDGGDAPDGTEGGDGDGTDGTESGGNEGTTDAEAFCAELEMKIQNADTEEHRAELQEIFDRECAP